MFEWNWNQNLLLAVIYLTQLSRITTHAVPIEDINNEVLNNLTSYVDFEIDPCEYFYSYACGNWVNVHNKEDPLPLAVVNYAENDYNDNLKNILEGSSRNIKKSFSQVFEKLVTFYESCRKQDAFDIQQYMNILSSLVNVQWPEDGETWSPKVNTSVWSILGKLASVGYDDLLFHAQIERHNATAYHLVLNKYKDNSYERMNAYHRSSNSDKKIQIIGQRMNYFVEKLYQVYDNNTETKPMEMTVAELQKLIPNIDFIAYFSSLRGEHSLSEIPIVVENLPYFRQLGDLMKTTTDDTLLHIIKMSLEGYFESIIPHNCVYTMRQVVSLGLDYLYDLQIYSSLRKSTNPIIQRIFRSLKLKFLDILHQNSKDFTCDEMEYLKDKLKKLKLNIGNLPQAVEDSYYTEYFENWEVEKHNFYINHLKALKHKVSLEYGLLKTGPLAATQTFSGWSLGSPAFSYSKNLLTIPFSYLNIPTFHKDFHELFLYAGLGNTLGHEILHAFDIVGLTYDSDGIPAALFADVASRKPKIAKSLQCLRDISQKYLNERMADFDGFNLAYDAYFQQPVVPDFSGSTNFTNKQLFYIKFAQFFCASNRGISAEITHDLPATRVSRIVENSQEFKLVFMCPEEEEIFTVEKCNMW